MPVGVGKTPKKLYRGRTCADTESAKSLRRGKSTSRTGSLTLVSLTLRFAYRLLDPPSARLAPPNASPPPDRNGVASPRDGQVRRKFEGTTISACVPREVPPIRTDDAKRNTTGYQIHHRIRAGREPCSFLAKSRDEITKLVLALVVDVFEYDFVVRQALSLALRRGTRTTL